jgi:hypothetical protein
MSHIGFRLVMTEHAWEVAQQRRETAEKAKRLTVLNSLQ